MPKKYISFFMVECSTTFQNRQRYSKGSQCGWRQNNQIFLEEITAGLQTVIILEERERAEMKSI